MTSTAADPSDAVTPPPARDTVVRPRIGATFVATAFVKVGVMACLCAVPILNIAAAGWLYAAAACASHETEDEVRLPSVLPLHRYFWLGLRGIAGTMSLLFVPSMIICGAWWAGWVFSYEGVRLYLGWAHFCAFVAVILFAPLLAYLPLAQVRFARTNRTGSFYEFRDLFAWVRARPWASVGCAVGAPLQLAVIGASRLRLLWAGFTVRDYILVNCLNFAVAVIIHRRWGVLYSRLEQEPRQSGPKRSPVALAILVLAFVIAFVIAFMLAISHFMVFLGFASAGAVLAGLWNAWRRTTSAPVRPNERGVPQSAAAWALLFIVSVLTAVLTGAVHFFSAHGPSDFFFHPAFLIPTAPYPAGFWVPSATP